jgi:hypothetical protein
VDHAPTREVPPGGAIGSHKTSKERLKYVVLSHIYNRLVDCFQDFLVLYQLANEDGSILNSLLQYSPSWIQKNMQASIVNNEMLFQRQRRNPRDSEKPSKVPPGATVTSSGRGWIVVEESTDEDEDGAADNPKEQRKRLRIETSSRVQKQIGSLIR